MSEDFTPRACRGRLWLPAGGGRSGPLDAEHGNGPGSRESGPLALRLRVREGCTDAARRERATGRIFLYFENNLLQSAAVDMALVSGGDEADQVVEPTATIHPNDVDDANRIDVDYVISGTLHELGPRFARRHLRLGSSEQAHRLRVNVTLNQDPKGTHRILVHGADHLPAAWTVYDPAAVRESLRSAREALISCYWRRDGRGSFLAGPSGGRIAALDREGGKSRGDFLTDLFHLAKAGRRLYAEMVHSLRPSDGSDPIVWERSLRERLAEAVVLQVSRIESAPTQYAYPWGLLYDYPLPAPSKSWKWCDVLTREWSREGRRDGPALTSCPYHHESWHQQDVLCPYGFWGLKHVIEQPLALRSIAEARDAEREVRIDGDVVLAVGWTRDATLDLERIDAHVEKLRRLPGVRLAQPPPNPAHDRDSLSAVLPSSGVAYLLCHCEDDVAEGQPFLWLGPRSQDDGGRIYVTTVTDWATTSRLDHWSHQRPLVFINGCHSSDLTPGEILNFVSAFGLAGASGVIGTEVSVKLDIAVLFAEMLLPALLVAGRSGGGAVGAAVRDVRWRLANRGNLLGLCYTFYGLADLHLSRSGDGAGSHAVEGSPPLTSIGGTP
jgi:hypothetical protein